MRPQAYCDSSSHFKKTIQDAEAFDKEVQLLQEEVATALGKPSLEDLTPGKMVTCF